MDQNQGPGRVLAKLTFATRRWELEPIVRWLDDILRAFSILGEKAFYKELYREIGKIRVILYLLTKRPKSGRKSRAIPPIQKFGKKLRTNGPTYFILSTVLEAVIGHVGHFSLTDDRDASCRSEGPSSNSDRFSGRCADARHQFRASAVN